MAYVVTENCVRCKYTDCVSACPVECFHEGPNFLVIDPVACIDCGVCVPECPVGAIYAEADLPEDQKAFVDINVKLAAEWPLIDAAHEPLDDAAEWADVPNKRVFLEMTAEA